MLLSCWSSYLVLRLLSRPVIPAVKLDPGPAAGSGRALGTGGGAVNKYRMVVQDPITGGLEACIEVVVTDHERHGGGDGGSPTSVVGDQATLPGRSTDRLGRDDLDPSTVKRS